jgi:hypothetical protein
MSTQEQQLVEITELMSEVLRITPEYIFTNSRRREIVDNRSILFYFMQRYGDSSLQKIGDLAMRFGRNVGFNHATVLYSIRKVKTLMSIDKEFYSKVCAIDDYIYDNISYSKLVADEMDDHRNSIIHHVRGDQDASFLAMFNKLTTLVYENKHIIAKLTGTAIEYANEEQTDEGIHQITPQNTGLGMV